MMRPFPRGFNRSFTCISGHLGPGLPNSLGSLGRRVTLLSGTTFPNNMQQGVQTDGTCNIQQGWKMLANNDASVSPGL